MSNNYCYNCKKRTVGCHGTCEIYKKYIERLDVIKLSKQKESVFKHRKKVAC